MQFEYDPVELIREVKRRPGLWNYNCKEHKCKSARERLWREVVRALNPATENLNKSDLHELELQLQRRWKSMRDSFTKQQHYPEKYHRHRPYIYHQELKFLKDHTSSVKRHSKNDEEDDEEQQNSSKDMKRWKKMAVARINESDDTYEEITFLGDDDDDDDVLQEESSQVKSPKTQSFVFADVPIESSPPHNVSLENDPDRLFLLSLLPNLKSVPEHQKLSVKMNMMQVLQDALEIKAEKLEFD